MDRLAKLVAACLLALGGAAAHAGYALPADPPGYQRGPGGGYYAPSANDARYGPITHTKRGPVINTGGRPVQLPASYRFAANAPRVAAAAIFLHPAVRTGVGIAAWLLASKLIWDAASGKWKSIDDTGLDKSDGLEWKASWQPQWYPSKKQACDAIYPSSYPVAGGGAVVAAYVEGNWCYADVRYPDPDRVINKRFSAALESRGSSCPNGWYVTPAGCVQTPPPRDVSKEDFEDALAPKPMPDSVPHELPQPTPLPVDPPWINPEPGPNPEHRPERVPTGDPVPIPNTNPQQVRKPYTDIIPSPTPNEPWRVGIRPGEVITTDRRPLPEPGTNPQPNPQPDPQDDPDAQDKPKPEQEQSLCEKHPDIVACQKLGTAGPAKPVPNENKDMAINQVDGWGPGNGACPPPRTAQVMGVQLSMPFDLLCDFANGLRPVVVGLAWLTAAFTFMGIGRRS